MSFAIDLCIFEMSSKRLYCARKSVELCVCVCVWQMMFGKESLPQVSQFAFVEEAYS